MTDDRDIVREWAILEQALKVSRRETLKRFGHTDGTYRSLKKDATTHLETLGGEKVPTEYGIVYLTQEDIYAHSNSKKTGTKFTIHLKEE